MAIVDAERVNRYLSSPSWTPAQWDECAELCEEVEDTLGRLLGGVLITPAPRSEVATILDSGLVATSQPVATVTALDGATLTEGAPLPAGWSLVDGRLRTTVTTSLARVGDVLTLGYAGGAPGRVQGRGLVDVSYLGGWGNRPALRRAVLLKVAAIMVNRHDDTIMVTDDGQSREARGLSEEWTAQELAALGTFRNLGAWR